jgi:plasmid maintenance system antidote protein VapI
MDEKLMDLLDMALSERFQLSYFVLRESDPQAEKLAQELITLSESIQNSSEIGQDTKDRINHYLDKNSELEIKFQKHLYIQGAKDCVAVLRELGITK